MIQQEGQIEGYENELIIRFVNDISMQEWLYTAREESSIYVLFVWHQTNMVRFRTSDVGVINALFMRDESPDMYNRVDIVSNRGWAEAAGGISTHVCETCRKYKRREGDKNCYNCTKNKEVIQ